MPQKTRITGVARIKKEHKNSSIKSRETTSTFAEVAEREKKATSFTEINEKLAIFCRNF